jgi:hypothetical protein
MVHREAPLITHRLLYVVWPFLAALSVRFPNPNAHRRASTPGSAALGEESTGLAVLLCAQFLLYLQCYT